MIPVHRDPEPAALASVRAEKLGALRALGRPPRSDEITGYRVVSRDLWYIQHYKCCYCEFKIAASYNDVEHYRPKAAADRTPGSGESHGYWWLAFTWENLLFACPSCNRTEKNQLFPLRSGSVALQPEQDPPRSERPLLIDPAGLLHPPEHIQYVPAALQPGDRFPHWWARPRTGSLHGGWTLQVCGLNRDELRELRGDHVERVVRPRASELRDALRRGDQREITSTLARCRELIVETSPFSLLSYDALRTLVPPTAMRARGLRWPDPDEVPLVAPRR